MVLSAFEVRNIVTEDIEPGLNNISQQMKKIENALGKVSDTVKKNTEDITECKEQIAELKVTHDENNDQQINIADEVHLQIKNANKLFVSKAKSEDEIKSTLEAILGIPTTPLFTRKINKRKQNGNNEKDSTNPQELDSFIIELTKEAKQAVYRNKANFFKDKPEEYIGFHDVLTKHQMKTERNRRTNKKKTKIKMMQQTEETPTTLMKKKNRKTMEY